MTLQEIFSTAFIGLRNQGFERSMAFGGCMYRGEGGLKCAIGHCIPDEKYTFDLEGAAADIPMIMKAIGADNKIALPVIELQEAHDNGSNPRRMEILLREFAEQYGLEVPA